jgi:hypothetical protein
VISEQFICLSNLISQVRRDGVRVDVLDVAIVVVALVHFVVALMPEVMFDALILHLHVPAQLAFNHQWGFDPSLYAMALIPMLGDWIFSIGYMLAGESGARLINLGFSFLLAWQAREIVLWAGGKENGAKWAVLIFLSTPLTYTETSSLFVEGVWAAFIVAGVMAVARLVSGLQENESAEIKVSGLMLGFAATAKALTLAVLPVFLLLLIFRWRCWISKHLTSSIIVGLLVFIVIGSIPYLTAWFIAGNPVHPFFNEIFKSSYYPAINFDNTLFKSGVSWDLLYRVTFDSGRYAEASNGASGFQWLLLLPAALVIMLLQWNRRGLLLLAFSVLSIILIFHSQSYLRYIYPVFLILIAVIGVALSCVCEQGGVIKKIFLLLAIFTLALNLLFLPSATWSYRNLPLNILLSDSARNQYLENRFPIRRAVEFVNYINPEHAPVAFFSQPFGAGLNADALYLNWYNHSFLNKVNKATDAQEIADVLREYGSNFVMLSESWGTSEKREIIKDATDRIADIGVISIRAVSDKYRFGKEFIENSDLSGSGGWSLSQGAKIIDDGKSFLVSVSSPATQTIKLTGGIRYINEVTARCGPTPTQGRIQINWHDEQMQFITASIKIFDCSDDWQINRQIVIAPKNATFGTVYAASHTTTPIEITRISLR